MKTKTFKVEVQIFDGTDSKYIENLLEYAFDEAGIDGVCYVEEVEEEKALVDDALAEAKERSDGSIGNGNELEVCLE